MDRTIERIERLNLTLIGVGAVVGFGTGFVHAPSFLLGGGVMHVNFWLLKKVVRAALSRPGEPGRGKTKAAVWLAAKGLLFVLLLSMVFIRYPVHAESFAVGVSLLLLACVIVSLSGPQADAREVGASGQPH